MKRRKRKLQTPEQRWSFKRHFQYKGILTGTKAQINQMLQDNNSKEFPCLTLTGIEISLLCNIQDMVTVMLDNYDKNTTDLKGINK